MFWPAAQQCLQDACGGAFTYRHAARNTDDIRNALPVGTEELFQYGLAAQVGAYIEVKQAGQWQINLGNFFQRQIFVYPF
ncbi:hypothetical protein D3C87_1921030 [compost metagenome]